MPGSLPIIFRPDRFQEKLNLSIAQAVIRNAHHVLECPLPSTFLGDGVLLPRPAKPDLIAVVQHEAHEPVRWYDAFKADGTS
jgi:hypothetical protein